ncbi:lytic transglycosylase domain-containing protein [Rhizomonospora bruguierae]|uniref:lytic transglycosylase domain-containing protein n=1 Tax=Rhizomonospora bruguierae TaxID=1581705 RepID=UPI001BCD85C2|nr:lytic murein transglycosylase [Micromonospora sp. NBRC 107566]
MADVTDRSAGDDPVTGETPRPVLRSSIPSWAGPLGSSGAAPEPEAEAPPAAAGPETTVVVPEQTAAAEKPAATTAIENPAEQTTAAEEPATAARAAEKPAATAVIEKPVGQISAVAEAAAEEPAEGEEPREGAKATAAGKAAEAGGPAADAVPPGRRRRIRFAHRLRRLPPPRRVAAAIAGYARRPAGRTTTSGLLMLLLVGVALVGGAVVVPATAGSRAAGAAGTASPEATPPAPGVGATDVPIGLPTFEPTAYPTDTATAGPTDAPVNPGYGGRPADVLVGWAAQLTERTGIPVVALQAYGYAELVLAQTTPGCHLSWTTLAAIGKVESGHGSANGATLGPDGRALPAIVGPPLNGTGGNAVVRDTDGGALDFDSTYDRAVGPMQFIPSTWRSFAVDADNDGVKDPNDIDDAALAAANYLCSNGRDLSVAADWWAAIGAYNTPQSYREAIYAAANDYGQRSRG